jgi:hypothetical protein
LKRLKIKLTYSRTLFRTIIMETNMNTPFPARILVGILLMLAFTRPGLAQIVVTKQSDGALFQQQGYLDNKTMRFDFLSGQSQTTAQGKLSDIRPMRRVILTFNGKTITVQNSGDRELYVKGQDKTGTIVTLGHADYALIKQNLSGLDSSGTAKKTDELRDTLHSTLSLLAAWPANMPVLVWQDGQQTVAAVNRSGVIAKASKNASSSSSSKAAEPAVLHNPDAALQLPTIEPLRVQPLLENTPITQEPAALAASTNSTISLCGKMGVPVVGSYPILSPTFLPPFFKVVGTESYKVPVGGVQCLARCGALCADSVSGVSGLGKNAYSQDCLDHDMCVGKRGSVALSCNYIFADAANDFFSAPCGHDLLFINTVVSNNPLASTQASSLPSGATLYAVFTVRNNGNTRLPHNRIYFDIYVDGVKKSTRQLPRILNASDASRYYFPIGLPRAYRPGSHNLKIQINAKALVQTATSNDVVNRVFKLL